jgi:hypothetical protein
MVISELKHKLFRNPKLLEKDGKVKIHPYNINKNITYFEDRHSVIYDFINDKIFRKDLDIKDALVPNPYKDQDGKEIDFNMYDYIENILSDTMLEYQLPEGNYALAIFDDKVYHQEDVDLIFYMMYHSSIQKKILKFTNEDISKITYNLQCNTLNWVWFKLDDSRLPEIILHRIKSWIDYNPELEFHLWTNLTGEDETKEWLKDISPEIKTFFLDNVKIHYKKETYAITKRFCEKIDETYLIWSFMYEMLENYGDRGSMIFKTDLVRCMILYLNGGWYSDFNDTMCLIPVKYLINPLNPEMIYIGCDLNHRDCNNYVMYSPKENERWLSDTKRLVNYSYRLYKILDIKDEVFTNFIQSMIRSFSDIAEKSVDGYIFDIFGLLLNKWMDMYNKQVEEMLSRNKIVLPLKMDFDMNKFILFVKFIMTKECPESPLVKRINYEFSSLKNMIKIKDVYRPMWKNKPEDKYVKNEADHKYWKSYSVTKSTIYAVFMQTNIKALIYMTNMGSFYQKVDETNPMYRIPYCYFHQNLCFLSGIIHILDCTQCGQGKDYGKNII